MKVLLLLSGGIDSPAAAEVLLAEGMELSFLYFDPAPLDDPRVHQKNLELSAILSKRYGKEIPYHTSPNGDAHVAFGRNIRRELQCVLCRRMMFRIAQTIAIRDGFDALATGESLGQVASQTLRNMNVISQVLTIPVLRPLLSLDKVEIERIAKDAGTYETSILPSICCRLVPDKPHTRAILDEVLVEEEKVDVQDLAEKAAVDLTRHDIPMS